MKRVSVCDDIYRDSYPMQMSQEIGLIPPEEDFINPFRKDARTKV